ncbi:MAG: 4-hydroxyphenylpyruvate dioxygenase [Candidatus Anammoxibacter sp.]
MSTQMGITGYDFIEFYVGSAKMVAYWYAKAMGFDVKGYSGPEYGRRDRTSYYLTKNQIKLVITSGLQPDTYDINSFVTKHGDGVKRWALSVDNVQNAFEMAVSRGAIPIQQPRQDKDDNGIVMDAAIKIYDDTEIVFINYDNYKGIFRPGFAEPIQNIQLKNAETGLIAIDHIVGNVMMNEMNFWADYFIKTMDFEQFIEFGPGDISTKYTGLLSKVVRTKDHRIKNPINEPYTVQKKSQIQEFLEEYHGSGVQHIAIACDDIITSVSALRKNGMEFLSVPDTYYELLNEQNIKISQDLKDLQELGILCDINDIAGKGYLLQLFTKPIGDRPSFFYEFIQRCDGSQGFGHGNFQALFESIERDQKLRGNL